MEGLILNAYEVTYIIDPTLTDDNIRRVIDKFTEQISKSGGTVVNVDTWGKRRLAYEIDGRQEGFYVSMKYDSDDAVSSELRRLMGLDEEIVRSLFIRLN